MKIKVGDILDAEFNGNFEKVRILRIFTQGNSTFLLYRCASGLEMKESVHVFKTRLDPTTELQEVEV